MDAKARRALNGLSCDVRFDEPLQRYGTYRIGGAADAVARPRTVDEVADVVKTATRRGIPYLAIGLGSNVLFDDAGFRGIILRIATTLADVGRDGPEETNWTVGPGLPVPILAKQTAKLGFSGVHRLIGVPGAVGGGVFMNAGAHGQDFAAVVQSVTLVTAEGLIEQVVTADIPWRYRSSGLDGIVVETKLELDPADPSRLQRELDECIKRRRAGTPFDQPCCGSVFRNPPAELTDHLPEGPAWTAGRLVEAAGLKELQIGGAQVSPMHANYIVNLGGATSSDVKKVIDQVQQTVHQKFGIRLAREVKFVHPEGTVDSPHVDD